MRKSVLVTGAARRIGRQLALDLAGDGWDVAVHCNASLPEAEEVARLIRGIGRRAAVVQGDLSSPDVPERLISEASAMLGGLTCLINNASLFEPDEVGSITPQSWAEHIDTNLRAPIFMSQAFARQLPAGHEGNIISIIDQRVWKLNPKFFSYTTSKSGLWTATRTLAQARPTRHWWDVFTARVLEEGEPHLIAARTLLGARFRWGGIPGGGIRSDAELDRALRAGTMLQRLMAIRAKRACFTLRDDAMDLIHEYRDERRASFFVDPPYVVGGVHAGRRLYRQHEVDQSALMAALARVKGKVMVTYPDDPAVRLLARQHGFGVSALPIRDGHRRKRTELMLTCGGRPP